MKLMAYFLVVYLMFFSSISGVANSMSFTIKASCCEKLDCKHRENQNQKKGCGVGLCTRMLPCSQCGFIKAPQFSMSQRFAIMANKMIYQTNMGTTSDYPENGWHPPKF